MTEVSKDPPKGRGVRSTLSDVDIENPERVRSPVPVDFEERGPQDFTPITNFAEMGPALSEIRHVVRDMKPKVDKLVEHNASHEARIKASESRLRRVEDKVSDVAERQHSSDCAQVETIRDLKEGQQHLRQSSEDITQRVVTTETKVEVLDSSVTETQKDTKTGRRWLIGLVASIVIIIGGAAFGWVITLVMVRSDVAYLTAEQQEMQERLNSVQTTTTRAGSRVEAAAKRIETVAQAAPPDPDPIVPLDDVWCSLSVTERERLRRSLPSDRLPTRRCP